MIVSHLLKPETLVNMDEAKLRNIARALEADLLKDPEAMRSIEAKISRYISAAQAAKS
jgi:hypothetical protein